MNKIEKLIKEMCPNGVEYKHLWEIVNFDKKFQNVLNEKQKTLLMFKHISAAELKSYENLAKGDVRMMSTGKLDGYINIDTNDPNVNYGEIISIPSGGAANLKYYKGYFLDSGNILCSSSDIKKFNLKFIFYFLINNIEFIQNKYRGSGIKHPAMAEIIELLLPIPPIEIQNEIVKILDTFTQLEAELEAELEARDKQYQYYRNKLLDFDNNQKLLKKLFEKDDKEIDNKVKYEKIEELFLIVVPPSKLKKDQKLISGKYPIIDQGDQNEVWFTNDFKNILPKSEYILFGDHTTNIKYVDFEFAQGGDGLKILQLKNLENNLTKYFYYVLQNIGLKIVGYKRHWSILKDILILIPSLEIQTKIVNILDKLQDYSKDIKTGLPLEIEQRQKQYEYCRDLLLDFKANAQGGALANSYIELLNSIEQKLLYSLEYKKLWELVNFDKKFNNIAKYKQEEILYFVHISAKKLKEYKLNSNGDVKILSTGNYEGFTNYIQNDSNINYGEIISIPSGGSPILKYYKGYFIDSLNILFSSKNRSKINLKYIYYFLINNIFFIEENFRGSSIKHPNMSTIIEINIPLPSIEVQTKIVNILDKLQDYSKDIKTGLPLEIEQRQKQYEYYRNLFLNLKKQDL